MKFNMGIIIAGVGALVLLAAFMGKPKLTASQRTQSQRTQIEHIQAIERGGGIPGLR